MKIIFCAMRIFKGYFVLYILLNIVLNIIALHKGENDRYKATKLEEIFDKPVYTFVKTDKHANIKWGVRHYVPRTLSY